MSLPHSTLPKAPAPLGVGLHSEPVSDVTAKPVTSPMQVGDLKPPHRSRAVLFVFMLSLIAAVFWASVGKIDQVTRAQGQVIAVERTQIIQSPDGGILTELHVKEGDFVKAGQLLATMQKERAQAAVSDTRAKVAALRITLARLQAEIFEKPLHVVIFFNYNVNVVAMYRVFLDL